MRGRRGDGGVVWGWGVGIGNGGAWGGRGMVMT